MEINIAKSLSSFWGDAKRVIAVSIRPTSEEFRRTLKIVLLGVLVLGILGFGISIITKLITGSARRQSNPFYLLIPSIVLEGSTSWR